MKKNLVKLMLEQKKLADVLRTANNMKAKAFDGYDLFKLNEVQLRYSKITKKISSCKGW